MPLKFEVFELHSWQKLVNPIFAIFRNLYMSCHFWQCYKAAISGNFTKLPYACGMQLYVQPILVTVECLWVATAQSGNFTKLPFLATAQSCHIWQLHKAAICGSYIYMCSQIWYQLSANFGKSLEVIIIPCSCHYWHTQLLQEMSITVNLPKLA